MSSRPNSKVKQPAQAAPVEKRVKRSGPILDEGQTTTFVHPLEAKIRQCRECGDAMISNRREVSCKLCRKAARATI